MRPILGHLLKYGQNQWWQKPTVRLESCEVLVFAGFEKWGFTVKDIRLRTEQTVVKIQGEHR